MISINPTRMMMWLSVFLLIFATMASANLGISATSGSGSTYSSLDVTYGATNEDALEHHIELSPQDGTLSNAIFGTGSLPWARLKIGDISSTKYADVERQVSGTAALTSYMYDWGTYSPTGGVGAWLFLDAHNARYIYGQSYARNPEGDISQSYASINSGTTVSSLSKYNANAEAYNTRVWSSQSANSASGKSVQFYQINVNNEGDYIVSNMNAFGHDDASPGYVFSSSTSGNSYRTSSNNYLQDGGSIGKTTQMYSYATNKAKMIGHGGTYYSGGGEFGVQKNNKWLHGSVTSTVTGGDAGNIDFSWSSPDVASNKKAYYLEPFHSEFTPYEDVDVGFDVRNTLMGKEYAFTHYWDGAVTRDKVSKMDDYYVSMINTHGSSDSKSFEISRANENRQVSGLDLKSWFTKTNGLTIIDACDSFKYTGTGTLYDALNGKSYVSGGFTFEVPVDRSSVFISRFFKDLAAGQSSGTANANAESASGMTGLRLIPAGRNFYLP